MKIISIIKNVCSEFEMKTVGECHDLYVKTDVFFC